MLKNCKTLVKEFREKQKIKINKKIKIHIVFMDCGTRDHKAVRSPQSNMP